MGNYEVCQAHDLVTVAMLFGQDIASRYHDHDTEHHHTGTLIATPVRCVYHITTAARAVEMGISSAWRATPETLCTIRPLCDLDHVKYNPAKTVERTNNNGPVIATELYMHYDASAGGVVGYMLLCTGH